MVVVFLRFAVVHALFAGSSVALLAPRTLSAAALCGALAHLLFLGLYQAPFTPLALSRFEMFCRSLGFHT
jgi:hypothetical protein